MTKKPEGWKFEPTRHGLASRGIETTANSCKAEGRLSEVVGEEVTDEDIENIIENEILPKEGKWYNYGDVNFEMAGGVAMKREGDTVVVKEIHPLPEDVTESLLTGERISQGWMRYKWQEKIEDKFGIDEDSSQKEIDEAIEATYDDPIYSVAENRFSISRLRETMNDDRDIFGGVWSFGDVENAGSLKDMIIWWLTATPAYSSHYNDVELDISHITEDFD